jgi:hypothetical protein
VHRASTGAKNILELACWVSEQIRQFFSGKRPGPSKVAQLNERALEFRFHLPPLLSVQAQGFRFGSGLSAISQDKRAGDLDDLWLLPPTLTEGPNGHFFALEKADGFSLFSPRNVKAKTVDLGRL